MVELADLLAQALFACVNRKPLAVDMVHLLQRRRPKEMNPASHANDLLLALFDRRSCARYAYDMGHADIKMEEIDCFTLAGRIEECNEVCASQSAEGNEGKSVHLRKGQFAGGRLDTSVRRRRQPRANELTVGLSILPGYATGFGLGHTTRLR